MSLEATPSGERTKIGFFGCTNAGKSSVVNAITGQDLSLVSSVSGTTTDPVKKAMELLPLGAVVIIDTPGLDDHSELGMARIKRAMNLLPNIDIAVLVADAAKGVQQSDTELISVFSKNKTPYIVAYNKCDLLGVVPNANDNEIYISATNGTNIFELKEKLAHLTKATPQRELISDLIDEGDIIVLVTPIDEAAPKGRLILPQTQTIRAILDKRAIAIVTQDTQLEATLLSLSKKPRLVITDSQVFGKVSEIVPSDIALTSFSMLFARFKGNLKVLANGARAIEKLKDGDKVLISEGCTHHRQCNDIGTVKLPNLLKKYTQKDIELEFTSGGDFPYDLDRFTMIIHCGGCMLTETEMMQRINMANTADVPITNYGTAIAYMNGILERAILPFEELL